MDFLNDFFAWAWASALSIHSTRWPSMRVNTGTLAECIEIVMDVSWSGLRKGDDRSDTAPGVHNRREKPAAARLRP